jgi:hypothetical protein
MPSLLQTKSHQKNYYENRINYQQNEKVLQIFSLATPWNNCLYLGVTSRADTLATIRLLDVSFKRVSCLEGSYITANQYQELILRLQDAKPPRLSIHSQPVIATLAMLLLTLIRLLIQFNYFKNTPKEVFHFNVFIGLVFRAYPTIETSSSKMVLKSIMSLIFLFNVLS